MPVLDEDIGEELLDACVNGDFEHAHWILHSDLEGNYSNWAEPEQHVSILHTLAYHDLLEACKLLLSYGADPNITNNNGETPLFWAVRMNCFAVVLTLLENGADTNIVDKSGSSPLHYACCHAVPEVIPLLLSYDCDPETRDVEGKTALESIEKNMEEDYFACTVLIRRHMRGVKKSSAIQKSLEDPIFESVDNAHAFDLISTGSRVANINSRRGGTGTHKKKFQVPRSLSPTKNIPPKPSFIAGSKTYYLHTPNSHSQRMHRKVMMSMTGGLLEESGENNETSAVNPPASDDNIKHDNSSPKLEENMNGSVCSLTNDVKNDGKDDDIDEDGTGTDDIAEDSYGFLNTNPNKFLALENPAVRNRLREFEPKYMGKYFSMPFVPDVAVAERFDVIISVEHCYNCHLHGVSVRHDKRKYATVADECLRKVIVDVMKNCGHLRVVGLKAEAKSSRIGALEVAVAMFLPSKNKNSPKESWQWKCKSIHSKLESKSWPKVKSITTQASEFISEMLDIYGYAPLDELRDEVPDELTIALKDTPCMGNKYEGYEFMKEVIRPDILYVTDTAKAMQDALALLKEKRDIRAVSRKEVDQAYLRWVDRTYGDAPLAEVAKKKILPDLENMFKAQGVFLSPPPHTDRRDYICWSHANLNHFLVYDGRLRIQRDNILYKAKLEMGGDGMSN